MEVNVKSQHFCGNTSVNWIFFTWRQAQFDFFFLKLVMRKKSFTKINPVICNNMDRTGDHQLKWNKPDTETQPPGVPNHMWNPKCYSRKGIDCSYQGLVKVERDGSMHKKLYLDKKKVTMCMNNREPNVLSVGWLYVTIMQHTLQK